VEPGTHDASRRTYLAEERTLLAWWRSGLAAFAVSVGVGRLLPALLDEDGQGPFVVLGVAYALLGLGLVLFGSLRERMQAKVLAEGGFAPLSRALVIALTAYRPCSGSPRSLLVLSV
jgi:putative membrane protein